MKIILQEEIKTRLVHLEKEIDLDYSSDMQELCNILKIDYYNELINIKYNETYVDNGKCIYVYKVKYRKEL